MSLRAFHLFFISVSAVMAAFCAAWAFSQFRAEHEVVYAAGAVLSALSVAGLAVYGAAFQRKTRHLS
jgi:predicted Co/Zn/Cd cation transporter (cation efflux family)